jgi:hypothetical protein
MAIIETVGNTPPKCISMQICVALLYDPVCANVRFFLFSSVVSGFQAMISVTSWLAAHLALIESTGSVYKFLVTERRWNRQLGRPSRRWEISFTLDLMETYR